MRSNSGKVYIKLVVIAVITAGVLTAFTLVRRNQFFASQAFMPASTANVNYMVEEMEEESLKVVINISTGDGKKTESISTVNLKVNLSSLSGNKLTSVDEKGETFSSAVPGETVKEENKWKIAVNEISEKESGLGLNFMVVNYDKGGYSSLENNPVAIIYVKGTSKNDLKVDLDKSASHVLSKRRPIVNIWKAE